MQWGTRSRRLGARHLYELASECLPAVLIEGAQAIHDQSCIQSVDRNGPYPALIKDWLPQRRPLRIAVLVGASASEAALAHENEEVLRMPCL